MNRDEGSYQLFHIYNNLFAPETERRTAIRQTVSTNASVEAETSTIIKKGCIFEEFLIVIVMCIICWCSDESIATNWSHRTAAVVSRCWSWRIQITSKQWDVTRSWRPRNIWRTNGKLTDVCHSMNARVFSEKTNAVVLKCVENTVLEHGVAGLFSVGHDER